MNDRENEIYKQGAEEVKNTYAFIHDEEFSCADMADMFLKGAIYADQNPRKGLWDAEKVISWIENNYGNYESTYADIGGYVYSDFQIGKFIYDLHKAMEE